jgi:hypothetical protein
MKASVEFSRQNREEVLFGYLHDKLDYALA